MGVEGEEEVRLMALLGSPLVAEVGGVGEPAPRMAQGVEGVQVPTLLRWFLLLATLR